MITKEALHDTNKQFTTDRGCRKNYARILLKWYLGPVYQGVRIGSQYQL